MLLSGFCEICCFKLGGLMWSPKAGHICCWLCVKVMISSAQTEFRVVKISTVGYTAVIVAL